jgi:hypothetical protein
MKRVAIFVYVWPEPYSSAAGVRTEQLTRQLEELGYTVVFFSPCKNNESSEFWKAKGIETIFCPANHRSALSQHQSLEPELVIYDRFVMEEQFGWQVNEIWPNALQFIDTQDLHHIRRIREKMAKDGAEISEIKKLEAWQPDADFDRELSSLFRADACFVVSSWEKEWLIERGYPKERVFHYAFSSTKKISSKIPWKDRSNFLFLGNFRHAPNLDAVKWLAIFWPKIHEQTQAKLVLVGAYPPQWISELAKNRSIQLVANSKEIDSFLANSRLLLAPLRFGAGIKGKVIEAWNQNTPVVGTSIAFEGMGKVASHDTKSDFLEAAVKLYLDETEWKKESEMAPNHLHNFDPLVLKNTLKKAIEIGNQKKLNWRNSIITRMLKLHSQNSYKYFSLWIEEKNRGK